MAKLNIDWDSLGFNYIPIENHFRCSYRNGEWGESEIRQGVDITLPLAATCFHYGQAVFEGLKAFTCADGKVRIFRPSENGKRLNKSLEHILAPPFPEERFVEAARQVVKANIDYVPPYGTGGSLYVRPFAIGSGPQIGVAPSTEYELIFIVMPVGAYYKGGIKPVDALVSKDFDRSAPRGTGHIKLGGNYAASLLPGKLTKDRGCQIALFLDSRTHEYIDEFGTSNFIGITKDGKYVTPKSESILPSITNASLRQMATDFGIPVEERPVHVSELAGFAEVGACGTAVVITPIRQITLGDETFFYGDECGPILRKLYDELSGIKHGEIPDRHGWLVEA